MVTSKNKVKSSKTKMVSKVTIKAKAKTPAKTKAVVKSLDITRDKLLRRNKGSYVVHSVEYNYLMNAMVAMVQIYEKDCPIEIKDLKISIKYVTDKGCKDMRAMTDGSQMMAWRRPKDASMRRS